MPASFQALRSLDLFKKTLGRYAPIEQCCSGTGACCSQEHDSAFDLPRRALRDARAVDRLAAQQLALRGRDPTNAHLHRRAQAAADAHQPHLERGEVHQGGHHHA